MPQNYRNDKNALIYYYLTAVSLYILATKPKRASKAHEEEEPCTAEEAWKAKREKKRSTYFDTPKYLPKPKTARKDRDKGDSHQRKRVPFADEQKTRLSHCPWGGKFQNINMSNTCTIDNFLYLLFILIQHNENVRLWFQQEATEKPTAATILRVAALFAGGRWAAGKLEWIRENIEFFPRQRCEFVWNRTWILCHSLWWTSTKRNWT